MIAKRKYHVTQYNLEEELRNHQLISLFWWFHKGALHGKGNQHLNLVHDTKLDE